MANMYLGWPNRVVIGAGVTVSGGDWLAALPASNILTTAMTQNAVSVNLANTFFDIDFSKTRTLRAFAIANHNMSRTAIWRIQLGSTPGASDIFDSLDLAIWRVSFDTDLLEWSDSNWWAGNYDDDAIGAPYSAIYMSPKDYSARYMRITLTDPYNTIGNIKIGRVFASSGVQPKCNMSYGMGDRWESLSQSERVAGGSKLFSRKRSYRVSQFTLDNLDHQTEFNIFYEMQRRLGTTEELLYIPDSADMKATQLTGCIATMRALSQLEYTQVSTRKNAFETEESI